MEEKLKYDDVNYDKLPKSLQGGARHYIERGIIPGSFLRAVISNNLVEAVARADDNNLPRLKEIVLWWYNEAPGGCWGSEQKMEAWSTKRYIELKGNHIANVAKKLNNF